MGFKRPHWRKTTWVILIFNVLMLVWIIAGASTAVNDTCKDVKASERELCEAAAGAGTAIGVGVLIFLWVAGDVILGVIWLVTNEKKTRECPVCGTDVKKGVIVCPSCNYDFAKGLPAQT